MSRGNSIVLDAFRSDSRKIYLPMCLSRRGAACYSELRVIMGVMKSNVLILVAAVILSLAGDLCTAQEVAADDAAPSGSTVVKVATVGELRAALKDVQPGTTIRVAPGSYSRGFYLGNVHGTAEAPVIIKAETPLLPPEFSGRGEGAKVSSCSYITLSGLTFQGFGTNGINVDDGGDNTRPSHHIILEKLNILDIGPQGNNDALKMSGVDQFIIRDCHFEGWGGSGVDLVGCHQGVIERSQFIGHDGYRNKNGVQIKGGSSSILVQNCYFQDAGERMLHIGGSTGLAFFRPPDATQEAKDVVVAGNRFVGGEASIAWVTCRYSHVHHNIFYMPEKWVGRILQETKDPRFKPCGYGLFEYNIIVTDENVRTHVNSGFRTEPSTFPFRGNAWYTPDGKSSPRLPTPEIDGVYDVDPQLVYAGTSEMAITATDPALASIGPKAYEPWTAPADFADIEVPGTQWLPAPESSLKIFRSFRTYVVFVVLIAVAVVAFKRCKAMKGEG